MIGLRFSPGRRTHSPPAIVSFGIRYNSLYPDNQLGIEKDLMNRILLKSKIHRATVTQAELHYEGSVTIDSLLLDLANIIEYEQVQIYNVTNGNRLTTYAIRGPAHSGVVCINGAAAHLVRPGDMIIICAYAQFTSAECDIHSPNVIFVDGNNRPKQLKHRESPGKGIEE